jgi:hypothetical protein
VDKYADLFYQLAIPQNHLLVTRWHIYLGTLPMFGTSNYTVRRLDPLSQQFWEYAVTGTDQSSVSMDMYALGQAYYAQGYLNPPGVGCGKNNPGVSRFQPCSGLSIPLHLSHVLF